MKTPFLSLLGWIVVFSAVAAAPSSAQSWPAGITPVRGVVTSVSGNVLTVNSQTGPVKIQLGSPLKVYKRTASDLSHVNTDEHQHLPRRAARHRRGKLFDESGSRAECESQQNDQWHRSWSRLAHDQWNGQHQVRRIDPLRSVQRWDADDQRSTRCKRDRSDPHCRQAQAGGQRFRASEDKKGRIVHHNKRRL